MKKYVHVIAALLSIATMQSYADEGFGICNYGKQSVPSVICFGPAILKNTVVTGNIKIVGPLTSHGVIAKSLSVTGTAELVDTQVANDVDITGSLIATGSHFFKNMVIQSDNITLIHSIVGGDILINSGTTKPIITLKCNSSVAGDITFGGVAGIVQVSDDSSMQGKIKNGVMEFIRVKCS